MNRISKKDYYLKIAEVVSHRSPCLKMKVGAIIVNNDTILSTGYNGPARGDPHCEACSRIEQNGGSEYIICPAVHAEENAIINAARQGVSITGGTLYLYTSSSDVRESCYRCKRAMKNAGILEVVSNHS